MTDVTLQQNIQLRFSANMPAIAFLWFLMSLTKETKDLSCSTLRKVIRWSLRQVWMSWTLRRLSASVLPASPPFDRQHVAFLRSERYKSKRSRGTGHKGRKEKNANRVGDNGTWQKVKNFWKEDIILLVYKRFFFFPPPVHACWKWRILCIPVSAIPKILLSLNEISCPRALHLQWHWLWCGVFHPFVTFLSWHHAYRQMFMPVNLLCFPPVTLRISNRKNTKSPICFFITQRINTKWGSLLSCCPGKPPHYSAPNKHFRRVNKSMCGFLCAGTGLPSEAISH